MTKNEFLSVLRGRITGCIPSSEVASQIDYYSAYIDGRIGAGMTEEDAVAELGDPLLIAKTVVESTDRAAEAAGYDGPYRSSTDTYDDSDGINSGIFGNSGANAARQNSYNNYNNNTAHQNYSYTGQDQGTGGYDNSEYQRAQGPENQQGTGGSGIGCIIAAIIFVIVMAVSWILTRFVFRLGFRMLGWLFPVVVIGGVVALVISLFRRR